MTDERFSDVIIDGVLAATRLQLLDDEEQRLATAIAAVRSVDLDPSPDDHDAATVALRDDEAADAASDTLEREIGFGMLEELETALGEVAAARRRVAAGTYGRCEGCGGQIAVERLYALPATRWCVRCADRRERVRFGRPQLS